MKFGMVAAVMLLMVTRADAHDLEQGPNGGQLVEAAGMHVEMVAKGRQIEVFLTDKNSADIPAATYKGVAILLVSGSQQRVTLTPATGNRLTGELAATPAKAPKGVVQLTADSKTVTAQFK